nr:hypothetical protein [Tanacetum cinerariifolium]
MEVMLDKHSARLYTLEQLDIPQQVSIVVSEVVTDAVDWAMQVPLCNRFRDLSKADMKEILYQCMWESDSYNTQEKEKGRESPKTPSGSPSHQPPPLPPPAGPSGASGALRASESQVTPPPPPPTSTSQDSPSKGSVAPSPLKTASSTKHQAWTMPDVMLKPLISLTPADLDMDEAMGPDEQAQLSDDEDIGNAHISTVNLRQDWWKPFEEERPTTLEPAWSIRSSDVPVLTNNWASALASNYSPPPEDSLLATFRTHMRILSVVQIEVFSMYGYDYMKKIVLRRADLNEHVIAKRDFKYMYPSDFEDLNLLNLQEDFQLGIESYQTQVNLTKPQWTATGFEYKHDYTVIKSPRAVVFQDKYRVQMMMRFNEIHKFSDGTLQQIDEALDYRVKELRINRLNPALNIRFWTRKDVDQCNAFMFAIQRRLRTRRIFRNLERFVGGRVREGDYRLLKRTD